LRGLRDCAFNNPIQTGDAHDWQLIKGFLEPALCRRVIAAVEAASGATATLSGHLSCDAVDALSRSAPVWTWQN